MTFVTSQEVCSDLGATSHVARKLSRSDYRTARAQAFQMRQMVTYTRVAA